MQEDEDENSNKREVEPSNYQHSTDNVHNNEIINKRKHREFEDKPATDMDSSQMERIKRKSVSEPKGISDNTLNTINNNTNTTVNLNKDGQVQLYPPSHNGYAVVEAQLSAAATGRNKAFNQLCIAKRIYNLYKNFDMFTLSHNKAEIKFRNKEMANQFLLDSASSNIQDLIVRIPLYKLQRRGIIRNYPIQFEIKDILDCSDSPTPITNVQRLNKFGTNPLDGTPLWTPSQTILLTFEGEVLPDSIKLYNSYSVKVELYIPPIKTCRQCLQYGHIKKFCKNTAKCEICFENKMQDQNSHSCPLVEERQTPRCFHCNLDHHTFHRDCSHYQGNAQLNSYMAQHNVNRKRALEQHPEISQTLFKTSYSRRMQEGRQTMTGQSYPLLPTKDTRQQYLLKKNFGLTSEPNTRNSDITSNNAMYRTPVQGINSYAGAIMASKSRESTAAVGTVQQEAVMSSASRNFQFQGKSDVTTKTPKEMATSSKSSKDHTQIQKQGTLSGTRRKLSLSSTGAIPKIKTTELKKSFKKQTKVIQTQKNSSATVQSSIPCLPREPRVSNLIKTKNGVALYNTPLGSSPNFREGELQTRRNDGLALPSSSLQGSKFSEFNDNDTSPGLPGLFFEVTDEYSIFEEEVPYADTSAQTI